MKTESEAFGARVSSMPVPFRKLRAGPGGRDRCEQGNVI